MLCKTIRVKQKNKKTLIIEDIHSKLQVHSVILTKDSHNQRKNINISNQKNEFQTGLEMKEQDIFSSDTGKYKQINEEGHLTDKVRLNAQLSDRLLEITREML